MQHLPHFRWNLTSDTVPGKRVNSTILMTEEQALRQDPTATKLPGSMEMKPIDETPEAFDPYDPRHTG
jgi:hypothetical protein